VHNRSNSIAADHNYASNCGNTGVSADNSNFSRISDNTYDFGDDCDNTAIDSPSASCTDASDNVAEHRDVIPPSSDGDITPPCPQDDPRSDPYTTRSGRTVKAKHDPDFVYSKKRSKK
jgi:hypothetical protein